ncbi:DNA-binding response OmpR family regulator [Catenuloplanes nepalensis]|uniref:Sensor-like histidine kinase SenX3 n=1 Tax=Catenuloplanes nepalensis TaxID=587533 RepID=A0ABT9MTR2_9ACTN|nr:response regulator [Catenuloplanes nepalensis]MDP9794831.1 DNA-binding response OmpR family regulator [Catenuloplanes nepalensis]
MTDSVLTDAVLIVDDSLTVRMDLNEVFEEAGFRTVLAATGAEARAAFHRERFDVIILDVLLPDADGVDLLRDAGEVPLQAGAVRILLSSEAEVKDRVRGLATGADEYVGKPYDGHFVVARSRELLRARGSPASHARTVLVIDDSPTFRGVVTDALEEAGYAVLTAGTGEEGLRVAADRRPSAVIVDGMLPGIDGATVIRRIRLDAALRNLPCLLLTASDDYATELQILDAGADAFVRKQEDFAVLLAKLAAVLRQTAAALPIDEPRGMHGPKKVLMIGADPGYLAQAQVALREDGYEVVLARHADDAMAVLAVQPADCVVLGAVPAFGIQASEQAIAEARQACERIKDVPGLRDIPLIMVGVEDGDLMLSSLSSGADDYVRTVDGPGTLRAHVRAHLRRKHLQDESRRIREELLTREIVAAEERAARDTAEARARMVDELEWRNRELEAFSGSVSHDLRAPLQTILGFTEQLLDDPDTTAHVREDLTRVHGAAWRMAALIESLLLLARASRGDISRDTVDVTAIATEVVDDFRQRFPDRSVTTVVTPGMTASGDVELVRVVLVNLFGNAWKFTGRTPGARIEIGCEDGVFHVRDNGAGFPADKADQLFRPFGRLHTNDDFPGTGIGLTTVWRIIDRHGGRIWAAGNPGEGASFHFTLPPA